VSLNWREIDRILSELELPGSFIQNVIQPDYSSLLLELYSQSGGRSSLYVSLKPGKTRLHRVREKVPRQLKLQRFAQLLRSRIKGGRIVSAEQIPGQRIVEIALTQGDQHLTLWLRLWGNAANILLCDETGTILDAFYRRPGRGEVSGGSFLPREKEYPPPDGKFGLRDEFAREDYNAAVAAFYAAAEENERINSRRAELLRNWNRYLAMVEARLAELESAAADTAQESSGRRIGDLLLSNLHCFSKGDEWVQVEDFETGETLEIRLDPQLSPQENAAACYNRHRKSVKRRNRAKEELEEQRLSVERTRKIRERVEHASTLDELASLPEAPRRLISPDLQKQGSGGTLFFSGQWQLLVGRNAKESDAILRSWARGNDYWVHARDYPGGHVFIRGPVKGRSVPLEVLLDAGNLAIHYSKGKRNGGGDCYYTQVKYLRRPREARVGTVLPTQEKNLSINLDRERLSRLLGGREE
jgi:predicted ribosome quality control (RQC) complex YloA/Tae2 family protein